jgi:hypothetical protein
LAGAVLAWLVHLRQVHPLFLLQKYTKNWRKRNFCAC